VNYSRPNIVFNAMQEVLIAWELLSTLATSVKMSETTSILKQSNP